jgi:hypothetical protein
MYSFLKASQVLAVQGSLTFLQSTPGAARDLSGIAIDIRPLEPGLQFHQLLEGRARGNGSFLALLFRHAADHAHVAHLITSDPGPGAPNRDEAWPPAELSLKLPATTLDPSVPSNVGLHHYWTINEYESPLLHGYQFVSLMMAPWGGSGSGEHRLTLQQNASASSEETIENLFGGRLYDTTNG